VDRSVSVTRLSARLAAGVAAVILVLGMALVALVATSGTAEAQGSTSRVHGCAAHWSANTEGWNECVSHGDQPIDVRLHTQCGGFGGGLWAGIWKTVNGSVNPLDSNHCTWKIDHAYNGYR
jgi:hypothetical protein